MASYEAPTPPVFGNLEDHNMNDAAADNPWINSDEQAPNWAKEPLNLVGAPGCCAGNPSCPGGGQCQSQRIMSVPPSQLHRRDKMTYFGVVIDSVAEFGKSCLKALRGGGSRGGAENPPNASCSTNEHISNLERRITDLEEKRNQDRENHSRAVREAFEAKEHELKEKDNEWHSRLEAELQVIKTKHSHEIRHLETAVSIQRDIAGKYCEQLSMLEQSNSKAAGSTRAHKDSHAIPPNLEKSVFLVNEAAFACAKTFKTFLKDRKALETHAALQSVPEGAEERYRTYALEAHISSRLFAGFENDGYYESSSQGYDKYLGPAKHEDLVNFFHTTQDLAARHERYLNLNENLQQFDLQHEMAVLKGSDGPASAFHTFCCRKLVYIMNCVDAFWEEFGDYSEHSLLHQLATNATYCDNFLKPFVNLAVTAFLLHRLAFQFNPPARIFRYAPGTKFEKAYMETAVPMDDDDCEEDLSVAYMLVPGFQVGATIIKCTVYLAPSSNSRLVSTPSAVVTLQADDQTRCHLSNYD